MAKPNKNKPGLASTRPAAAHGPKPEPEMAEVVQEVSTEAPAPAAAMPDDVGPVVAGDELAAAEGADGLALALAVRAEAEPTISHEEVGEALGLMDAPIQKAYVYSVNGPAELAIEFVPPAPATPKSYVVIGGGSVKYEGKHYFPGETIPMPDDMAATMPECIGVAE